MFFDFKWGDPYYRVQKPGDPAYLVYTDTEMTTSIEPYPFPEEVDGGRRRLKNSVKNIGLCMQCGATDSPEFRSGPEGRRSLCNRCGLRFAKTKLEQAADTMMQEFMGAQSSLERPAAAEKVMRFDSNRSAKTNPDIIMEPASELPKRRKRSTELERLLIDNVGRSTQQAAEKNLQPAVDTNPGSEGQMRRKKVKKLANQELRQGKSAKTHKASETVLRDIPQQAERQDEEHEQDQRMQILHIVNDDEYLHR